MSIRIVVWAGLAGLLLLVSTPRSAPAQGSSISWNEPVVKTFPGGNTGQYGSLRVPAAANYTLKLSQTGSFIQNLQLGIDGISYVPGNTVFLGKGSHTIVATGFASPKASGGSESCIKTELYDILGRLLARGTYCVQLECGNSSLIQSNSGIQKNFEVLVPYPAGGLAHYWRNNDDIHQTWHGPTVFGVGVGFVNAVSLIQSSFGGGRNLEVVARIGDRLAHFWRDGSTLQWYGPNFFASGVSGTPSFIQSRFGSTGNFEVVVPLWGRAGMAHYWRDNDQGFTWHGPTIFKEDIGAVSDVALIQGSFGNLEAVARTADKRLAHFWRGEDNVWHGPYRFGSGASGPPSFLQNRIGAPGNFEVVAPLESGDLGYFWRDHTFLWHGPFSFHLPFGAADSVALIQSNYRDDLEIVARRGCSLVHSWRESSSPMEWHFPVALPQ